MDGLTNTQRIPSIMTEIVREGVGREQARLAQWDDRVCLVDTAEAGTGVEVGPGAKEGDWLS